MATGGKPCKQLSVKNLSGPDGVYDVKLGPASVENRAQRDLSKDGSASAPAQHSFDDHTERMDRYSKALKF